VIDALSDLLLVLAFQPHTADNGPEFVARSVQEWIAAVEAKNA
jgi:hypothetical protein